MHTHCFGGHDGDHLRCCGSHRAVLAHPYNMPNHRQVLSGSSTGGGGGGTHIHSGMSPSLHQSYTQDHGLGHGDGHGGPGDSAGGGSGMDGRGQPHEDSSSQRKRIAVACGRCRKRKIRCSGDAGTGEPCSNCRNAGYSPCQFLRVQSLDADSLKDHTFNYNMETSRQFQARGSSSLYGANNGGTGPSAIPPFPYQATGAHPLSGPDVGHLNPISYRPDGSYSYGPEPGPARNPYMSWSTSGYNDNVADPHAAGNSNTPPPHATHGIVPVYGNLNAYAAYNPPTQEPRYPVSAYPTNPYGYGTHPIPSVSTMVSRPAPQTPPAHAQGLDGLEESGGYTYNASLPGGGLQQPPIPPIDDSIFRRLGSPPYIAALSPSSTTTVGRGPGTDVWPRRVPVPHRRRSGSMMPAALDNRSTASPTTSHNEPTPSSSYGSYTSSPGYSASQHQAASQSDDNYTSSPGASAPESSTEYHSRANEYVYHDTTAAALLAAVSTRRVHSPVSGGSRSGNNIALPSPSDAYTAPQSTLYAMPTEQEEDGERNPASGRP